MNEFVSAKFVQFEIKAAEKYEKQVVIIFDD